MSGSGTTSSTLRAPLELARAKIRERVDAARPFLEKYKSLPPFVISANYLRDARNEFDLWNEHNRTLLSRIFSTDNEVRAYDQATTRYANKDAYTVVTGYYQTVVQRIGYLEALANTLDFFRQAGSPSVEPVYSPQPVIALQPTRKAVFVVHGRDEALKQTVARFIMQLDLTPIILAEQVDQGRTIIEKFMEHADEVAFAVILLTPDDVGRLVSDAQGHDRPRARQNVILELGYFLAKLGAKNVCALYKGDMELPSDIAGLLYKQVDPSGAWRVDLAREMKAAGITIDLNKIVS